MKRHERKYRYLLTTVLSVTALMLGMLALPAVADTGTGEVAIEGTASLPEFPSVGGNTGTFSGTVVEAALAGNDGTADWAVTGSGGAVSATFDYSELNCEIGEASGSGTIDIDNNNGTVAGTYGNRDVTDVHADFTFTWDRVGNTAVITADVDVELTFSDGGPSPIQVITGHDAFGEAGFVPIPSDPVAFEEACSGTGDPVAITAEVAAAVEVLTD